MNKQGQVRECIALAQTSLVRARVSRQEADVHAEFSNQIGNPPWNVGLVAGCRQMARAERLYSRSLLMKAERLNGQLYLELGSDAVVPLKTQLCGRDFRLWNEYAEEYLGSDLFRGVDPER